MADSTYLGRGTYLQAIEDLRQLLLLLGRRHFRQYGYARQLRAYRAITKY